LGTTKRVHANKKIEREADKKTWVKRKKKLPPGDESATHRIPGRGNPRKRQYHKKKRKNTRGLVSGKQRRPENRRGRDRYQQGNSGRGRRETPEVFLSGAAQKHPNEGKDRQGDGKNGSKL